MSTHPYRRYVALGDSFTEGVGDPDPARPNGVRGWADRVAEVLGRAEPDFGYANLAIRGRKLGAVVGDQVSAALALEPDLVTMYGGANDILRPQVDLDALMATYDEAVARLTATGARVLVWTAFDPGASATYKLLRGRFALYSEAVRESADRHGADIVDFWRMREYRDWGYWDADRMHLAPAGHQQMATAVLDVLGVPHGLEAVPLFEHPVAGRVTSLRTNATWVRTTAAPWVHRRLTGRSSGDGLDPRHATFTHLG
ncbi:SGNH/GDSL hydrolase family protein [Nocardioides sp.]|uniref:SGNH/GDSL hydrolase family protein n=1 Tax=Nocardioides sp. TaxID=35761 RepID=UPI002725ECD3|nr:SGNH/GDSL hydrolase family protein [Nocardioides sp.]MDO9454686.1 SGNH/GDSL hydrolase family protein [Nocardioides sp.]